MITQADAPTIRVDCHPIQTKWCPHLCIPTILRRMPFLAQPSQFILVWDRHQICWLAYLVEWLNWKDNRHKFKMQPQYKHNDL